MDLSFKPEFFDKKVDPATGSILFFRRDMRGIPDRVVEGDGFTVEFKDDQVFAIDIFSAPKVMEHLLQTIPAPDRIIDRDVLKIEVGTIDGHE